MNPTIISDTRQKALYQREEPQPNILFEDERAKVIVGALEAGQQIPVHPEALAVYHFLEGTGQMAVDGETVAVKPGTTIVTPRGSRRGVEAETRLSFLAVRIAE